MAILKLHAESWVIYARMKDHTLMPVATAFRRACDACRTADSWFKDKKHSHCGYIRGDIVDFVVCKRTDDQIWSARDGTR